ncbi:MAG: hypothetical protein ACOY0T_31145 [Myxococcota bacterium]
MATASPALIKWLTRLLSDLTEEGPITRFELTHVIEGEHSERLELWPVSPQSPPDPQDFGTEIYDRADSDAQSRMAGQPQRYVVYAYRGKSELHESQHAFLARGKGQLGKLGDDTEPPTGKGLLAHFMRHDESVHRLLMSANESLLGRLAQDLERERVARQKAEEINWSMFERYQNLLDREHERRLAEAKELMKARRMDELMGVVTALLPILATKFLGNAPSAAVGAGIAPAPARPAELVDSKDAAVREFLNGLSEAEVSSVLASLSTSNQLGLIELHRSFSDESATVADVMARHITIRKFLKGLDENEMKNILASLTEANRGRLLALYAQYRVIEEQEQGRKPEILRS